MEAKRVYEDIEPFCKWKSEEQQEILEVHLQGYRKDQLRVQINNVGILTITGERPLDDSKWSRFRKVVEVSKECKPNEIHAKFSGGILYVTMPKKIAQQQHPNAEPQAHQKNQENSNPTQKINQDKVPGAKDKITSATGKIGSSSMKMLCKLKTSVPKIEMGRKTALQMGALLAVVVVVGVGAYVTYKYRQAFHVDK